MWLVYVLTVLQLAFSAFFEPAKTAAIPSIVSDRELLPANAISSVTWSAMLTLGAALGGLVAGWFGTNAAFVLDSLTFIASAGLIALEQGPARLHKDHENAKFLAEGLATIRGIAIAAAKVRTNILIFDIGGTGMTSDDMTRELAARNILAAGVSSQAIRLVTHLDGDRSACAHALDVIRQICK